MGDNNSGKLGPINTGNPFGGGDFVPKVDTSFGSPARDNPEFSGKFSKLGLPKIKKGFESAVGIKSKRDQEGKAKRADEIRAKELREFKKRQEDFKKDREDQRNKLRSLFEDFQDPEKTLPELEKKLNKVQETADKNSDLAQIDINSLRDIANTQGPTGIAQALTNAQLQEENIALQNLETEGRRRGVSAFEDLAARGGAGAGSRERLLGQAGQQNLLASQRQRQQGQLQRLGILSDDEKRKLQAREAALGGQLNLGQFQAGVGQNLASMFQGAQTFDVGQQQSANRFRTTGLAGIEQGVLDQMGKDFATDELAFGQRMFGGLPQG
jgi:hypothetical protein